MPAPTIDPCVEVNGIQWVFGEKKKEREGITTLTTYGRKPAVEVTFLGSSTQAAMELVALGEAVSQAPQTSKCL